LSSLADLLAEQARYYRERAGEYDDWWFRRGRYDHGPELGARWSAEIAELEAALDRFAPAGDVLELACGTGLWTARLGAHAESLTALDASAEVLALARVRAQSSRVSFVQADIFSWEPPRHSFDVCFFSFWLSHVPDERFEAFWRKVELALRPRGRVFLIDSLRHEQASAVDHRLPGDGDETMERRLSDGREFRIVKRFHKAAALQRRLASLGWDARIEQTREFFLFGEASRADG